MVVSIEMRWYSVFVHDWFIRRLSLFVDRWDADLLTWRVLLGTESVEL